MVTSLQHSPALQPPPQQKPTISLHIGLKDVSYRRHQSIPVSSFCFPFFLSRIDTNYMHPQRSPFPAPKQNMKKNHLHHHHQDKLTLKGSALEGDEKLLLLLLQEAKGTTVSDVRVEEEEEKGSRNVVAVVVVTIADAIAISLPRSKCEW